MPCSWLNLSEVGQIHYNAAVEENFSQARQWLRNCVDSHPKCGAGQSSVDSMVMLPTRVIDVGPLDGSQEPRLLISDGKRAPYISLSHCWGGSQHTCKLSHDTLLTWQQGIPLASLPRTFRDAVHVTRKLEQRYLWIDSLCIIQPTPDDDSDWQKEGAVMGDIYRNSICNIAATVAKNSHSGFLTERPGARYLLKPCKLQDINNKGIYVLPPQPSFSEIVDNAPLNRRAWVLQERMLSPRILHWAPEGMFWQCTKTWASEDAPDGLMYEDPGDVAGVDILTLTTYNATTWEWFRLIENYTNRGMTNDADKLPALSGISRIIGSNTGSRYYAGLWLHPTAKQLNDFRPAQASGAPELSFTAGLMWQSDSTISNTPRRPKSYVAPSWSWASVVGAIRYSSARGPVGGWMDIRWEIKADVVAVDTAPVVDPYGQVSAGRLEICGVFLDGFRAVPMPGPVMPDSRNGLGAPTGPQYCALLHADRPRLEGLERYSDGAFDSHVCFDVVPTTPWEDFSCLLIATYVNDIVQGSNWRYSAMALTRSQDGSETYERVGWARLGDGFSGCFDRCKMRTLTVV